MAGTAATAAADTIATVGDRVSRRQGDEKHAPDPRCADVQRGHMQGLRISQQQQQQQRQQQEVKMAQESAPQQHLLRGI